MREKRQACIGLGDINFTFAVYIQNQPNMEQWQGVTTVVPLQETDIEAIGRACGNGWRKVFNVYAKVLYALDNNDFQFSQLAATWQAYRDEYLLQENSATALLFSAPALNLVEAEADKSKRTVHIICGRTYAKQLLNSEQLNTELLWLDEEFAINFEQHIIVCPYFDYRQLSNIKIQRLARLLSQLLQGKYK
ncbi:DUF6942 family protein [Psychromonas sp. B3M02]|uniref:DUF6942 family protein n=1 Tax=Psychromonas sp. B3M02 TaxID=2267226 RepID=UPI00215D890C|nr:hypothetical protein [Psychromonas sp. B3M02]